MLKILVDFGQTAERRDHRAWRQYDTSVSTNLSMRNDGNKLWRSLRAVPLFRKSKNYSDIQCREDVTAVMQSALTSAWLSRNLSIYLLTKSARDLVVRSMH